MLTTEVFYITILVGLTQCQGQNWGADLSASINNIVHQSLEPLRNMNLTPIINAEYERAWNDSLHRSGQHHYGGHGYGYGYGTPETGYNYSYNYSYPGYSYSYSYPSRQTTVIRNFWNDFNAKLEAQLEPVRDLERIVAVKRGFDGYTVVKFKPSNRVFLIRNGIMYECTGDLSLENGQCTGDLKRFEIKEDKNYCFLNNKIVINHHFCFVPNNEASIVTVINGAIICQTRNKNAPAFLISTDDYEKLCQSIANSADYVYFPNDHINTRNLMCNGEHPKKCTYSESSRTTGPQEIVIQS